MDVDLMDQMCPLHFVHRIIINPLLVRIILLRKLVLSNGHDASAGEMR